MSTTSLRQKDQIRSSDVYNDNIANPNPSVASPANLEDDLNAIRTQLKNILGEDHWWSTPKIDLLSFSQKTNFKWYTIEGNTGSIEPDSPADDLYIVGDGTSVETSISGDTVTIENILPYFKFYEDSGGTDTSASTDDDTLTFIEGTSISIAISSSPDQIAIDYSGPVLSGFNAWFTIQTDSGSVSASRRQDELTFAGEGGITTDVTLGGKRISIYSPQDLSTSGTLHVDQLKLTGISPKSIVYVDGSSTLVGDPSQLAWDYDNDALQVDSPDTEAFSLGRNRFGLTTGDSHFKVVSSTQAFPQGTVYIHGDRLVVIGSSVSVYDFSRPERANLKSLGTVTGLSLTGTVSDVQGYGNYVIFLEDGNVYYIDLLNYTHGQIQFFEPLLGTITAFDVVGSSLFYVDGTDIGEVDISDLNNPSFVRSKTLAVTSLGDIAIKGNYAFCIVTNAGTDTLRVFDLKDDFAEISASATMTTGAKILDHDDQFVYVGAGGALRVYDITDVNNISLFVSSISPNTTDAAFACFPYVVFVDVGNTEIRLFFIDKTAPSITTLVQLDFSPNDNPGNVAFSAGYMVISNGGTASVYKFEGLEAPTVLADTMRAELVDVLGDVSTVEPSFVHQGVRVGYHGLHVDEGTGLRTDGDIKVGGQTAIGGHEAPEDVVDIREKMVVQKNSVLREVARVSLTDPAARGICVEDNMVYVSGNYLTTIDFSDISSPSVRVESAYPSTGTSGRIIKVNDYIFTESDTSQVYIYNVGNPDAVAGPTIFPQFNTSSAFGTQSSGAGTIVARQNFPSPQISTTGTVEIWNGSSYDSYAYTNYQTDVPSTGRSTFTLSGTLSQEYATGSPVRVPALDGTFNATGGNLFEGWSKYGNYLITSSRNIDSTLTGKELAIYDLTTPTAPVEVFASSEVGVFPSFPVAANGYIYVHNGSRLGIYDIEDMNNVQYLGTSGVITGTYAAYAIRGRYFYGTQFANNFVIYDISDPSSPVNVGSVGSSYLNGIYSMELLGNLVVASSWNAIAGGRLVVIDCSDVSNPVVVQSISVTADDYAISNRDSGINLDNTVTAVSHSFEAEGQTLKNVTVALDSTGTPTGEIRAVIYAHAGVFGTSSTPTGLALAISEAIDASTLSGSYEEVTFYFPPSERFAFSSQYYTLVIEYSDGTVSDYISLGTDSSAPSHGGNAAYFDGSWNVDLTQDVTFVLEFEELDGHGTSFSIASEGNRIYVVNENTQEVSVYEASSANMSAIKTGKLDASKSKIDNQLTVEGVTSTIDLFSSDSLMIGTGQGTVVEGSALLSKELAVGKGNREANSNAALDVRGRSFVVENDQISTNEFDLSFTLDLTKAIFHNGLLWGLDVTDYRYQVIKFNENPDFESLASGISSVDIGGIGNNLKLNIDFDFTGEYLIGVYYQDSSGYMRAVDVTYPADPQALTEISLLGLPSSIDIYGRYAYVCYSDNAVIDIYDVSDPTNIVLAERNSIGAITFPKRVVKKGNLVFVGHEGATDYISILRQSGTTLSLISSFDFPNIANKVQFEIVGDHILVLNEQSFGSSYFTSVRISDVYGSDTFLTGSPADLQKYTPYSISGSARGFVIAGDVAYVATATDIYVMDISDIHQPTLLSKEDALYNVNSNQIMLGNRLYNFTNTGLQVTEIKLFESPGIYVSELLSNSIYTWGKTDVGRRFDPNSMSIGPGGLYIDNGKGLSTDSDFYVKGNSSIGLRLPSITTADTGSLLNIYGKGLVQIPDSNLRISTYTVADYGATYSYTDAVFFGDTLFVGLYSSSLKDYIEVYSFNSQKEIDANATVGSSLTIDGKAGFNIDVSGGKIYYTATEADELVKITRVVDPGVTPDDIATVPAISEVRGDTLGFKVLGNTLILFEEVSTVNDSARLQLINISDPENPVLLYEKTETNELSDFKLNGSVLHYCVGALNYFVLDISDPENVDLMRSAISIASGGGLYLFAIKDETVYHLGANGNLWYVQLRNIGDDTFTENDTSLPISGAIQMEVEGDYLFVLTSSQVFVFNTLSTVPELIESISAASVYGSVSDNFSFMKVHKGSLFLWGNKRGKIGRIDFGQTSSPMFNSSSSVIGSLSADSMISMGDLFAQFLSVGEGGIYAGKRASVEGDLFVSGGFLLGEQDTSVSDYDIVVSSLSTMHYSTYDATTSRAISTDTITKPKHISVDGNYIYLVAAVEDGNVYVLSDEKTGISSISSYEYTSDTTGIPTYICHNGNLLFVFFDEGTLVLDVSNKKNLQRVAFYQTTEHTYVQRAFSVGNKLYTVYTLPSNQCGSAVWDISDPENLSIIRTTDSYAGGLQNNTIDIKLRDNTIYVLRIDGNLNKVYVDGYYDLDLDDAKTTELNFDNGIIASAFDMKGGIMAFGGSDDVLYFYSLNRAELDSTETDAISSLAGSGDIIDMVFNHNDLIVLRNNAGTYKVDIVSVDRINSPYLRDSFTLTETSVEQMVLYDGHLYFCNSAADTENGVFVIRPKYFEVSHMSGKSILADSLNISEDGRGAGHLSVVNNMTLSKGGSFQGGIKTPQLKFVNSVSVGQGLDRKDVNVGGRGLTSQYQNGVVYSNYATDTTTTTGASDIFVVGNFLVLSASWSEEIQVWDLSDPENPTFLVNSSTGGFRNATDGQFLYTADNKTGHIRSFQIYEDGRVETVSSLFLDANLSTPVTKFVVRNGSAITVEGKYAYVLVASTNDDPTSGGIGLGSLFIVDISDPSDMKIVSRTYNSYLANARDATNAGQNDFSGCFNLHKQGNRLYVINSGSPTGVTVVDVSNVHSPSVLDVFFDGSDTGAYEGLLSVSQQFAIKGRWGFLTHQESTFGSPAVNGGITVLDFSSVGWDVSTGSSISIVNHYTSDVAEGIGLGFSRSVVVYNDYLITSRDGPDSAIVVHRILSGGELEYVTEIAVDPAESGLDQVFVYGKYLYFAYYNDPDTRNGKIGIVDLGGLDLPNSHVSRLQLSNHLYVTEGLLSSAPFFVNGGVSVGYEGIMASRGISARNGFTGQKFASFHATSSNGGAGEVEFGDGATVSKTNGNVGAYAASAGLLTNVFNAFTAGLYIIEFQGNIGCTGTYPEGGTIDIYKDGVSLHTFSFDIKGNSTPLNFSYPVEVDDTSTAIQIKLNTGASITNNEFTADCFLKVRRVS